MCHFVCVCVCVSVFVNVSCCISALHVYIGVYVCVCVGGGGVRKTGRVKKRDVLLADFCFVKGYWKDNTNSHFANARQRTGKNNNMLLAGRSPTPNTHRPRHTSTHVRTYARRTHARTHPPPTHTHRVRLIRFDVMLVLISVLQTFIWNDIDNVLQPRIR